MIKHHAISFCLRLIFLFLTSLFQLWAQTADHILRNYELTWADEFNGTVLDTSKWSYRAEGSKRAHGVVSRENVFLDGKGVLHLQVSRQDTLYFISQVGSQNKLDVKYGYFECRAKMNKELGPHVAFWLQSPLLGKIRNDPGKSGTEIDIFEYHLNDGKDYVYHNLHWNGYGEEHQQAGTRKIVDGLHNGFHTFGLEWTESEYVFYVDGVETWRTNQAISHIEQYLILSAELTGWGGEFKDSDFPDDVLFDYVRVYQKK